MEKTTQEQELPNFGSPITEIVERYPDGEQCNLVSLDPTQEITEEDLATIVSICSEPRVFKLFAHIPKFANGYTSDHARGFVEKAKEGWQQNSKYTFLVRNSMGKIVACLDIKSSNLDDGEIGYWASENYPGIMTNAVLKLCDVARKAGFRHLHALVRLENEKSTNVVTRAGLKHASVIVENETTYNRYEISL